MNRRAYLILRMATLAGATALLALGSYPVGIVLAIVFIFLALKTPAPEAGPSAAPMTAPRTPAPLPLAAPTKIHGIEGLYGRLPKP